MYCLGSYRKQQIKNVSILMIDKTHSAFQRLNHVYNRVRIHQLLDPISSIFPMIGVCFFCLIVDKINI